MATGKRRVYTQEERDAVLADVPTLGVKASAARHKAATSARGPNEFAINANSSSRDVYRDPDGSRV